jgi:hypothetical protein
VIADPPVFGLATRRGALDESVVGVSGVEEDEEEDDCAVIVDGSTKPAVRSARAAGPIGRYRDEKTRLRRNTIRIRRSRRV